MKGKARRLLSWVCVLALCMSLLPVTALAAPTESGTQENPVTNTKNQVTVNKWVSQDQDGSYRLNMEAYASNEVTSTTTTKPLDIVLVLDVSGSMDDGFGESGYVYSLVEKKTNWSYNDISSRTYYYEKDGKYYPVVGKADWSWETREYENYRIGYETGSWWDPDFHQLGKASDDPAEDLVETTLYTRHYEQAGTKLDSMKTAVNSFIDSVAESAKKTEADHQISVVQFAYERDAHSNYPTETVANLTSVNTEQGVADLKEAVNGLRANGATRADEGLKEAQTVLNRISADRNSQKVVVLFTDGEPTSGNSFEGRVAATAVNTAKDMKDDNVTIYTVGIFEGADPSDTTQYNANRYMNAVSSNYPSATAQSQWYGDVRPDWDSLQWGDRASGDYYLAAENANGLEEVFKDIADTVTDSTLEVYPDAQAVLTDTLSQYFNFPSSFNATEDVTAKYIPVSGKTEDTYTWDDSKSEDMRVDVTTDGDTIEITGFDYVDHAVTLENDEYSGGKLVVSFPIELDINACRTDRTEDGLYPTNSIDTDTQAGLKYKENAQAEKNTANTLLPESPKVAVDVFQTGDPIHIDVYVDGDLQTSVGDWLRVTPVSDSSGAQASFDPATDNVTYEYTYYNCKDIGFTAKNGYVIQGIDAKLVYGQSGCKGIYDPNTTDAENDDVGTLVADNVKNGTTVAVYLSTLYSAQFHTPDEQQYGDIVSGLVAYEQPLTPDNPSEMGEALRPEEGDSYIENEKEFTYVEVGDGSKDHAAVAEKGQQEGHGYVYVAELDNTVTMPALPDVGEDFVANGWWLNDTDCDGGPDYQAGASYTVDAENADNNKIIHFYSSSAKKTGTVVINYQNEDGEPIKDSVSEVGDVNEKYTFTIGNTSEDEIPFVIHYESDGTTTKYVFDHLEEGSLTGTYTNGQQEITAVYKVDSDDDDKDIPDEYIATVTYKVVNGTWRDTQSDEVKTANFELRTFDPETNIWVESNPTLGTIPAAQPNEDYLESSGAWYTGEEGNYETVSISKDTPVTEDITYTYCYTTEKNPALEVYKTVVSVGGVEVSDQSKIPAAKVGDTILYKIEVKNTGNVPLNDISIQDSLNFAAQTLYTDADCTAALNGNVSLGTNETGTYYAKYVVTAEDAGSFLINIAKATSGDTTSQDTVTVTVAKQYTLTVNYYYDSISEDNKFTPENTTLTYTLNANDPWSVEIGGSNGTHNAPTEVFKDGTHYTFDRVASTSTLSGEIIDDVVVNLVYSKDVIGGGEYPDTPDQIPDKYQVTIEYKATEGGSIAENALTKEVKTIYAADDTTYAESGTVTATGSTATAAEGYFFNKWTKAVNASDAEDTSLSAATGSINLNTVTGGDVITFTAYFTKEDPKVSITKALTSVTRDEQQIEDLTAYTAQVGDRLTYTITVINKGNITLETVTVEDEFTGSGTLAFDVPENVTVNGNTLTISNLSNEEGRNSVSITATYTVQPDDISKDTIVNTANAYIGEEGGDPDDTAEETVRMDDYTVTINPADITIYTGGEDYSGVVDGSGNLIGSTETNTGLPEPGYHITLPAAVTEWLNDKEGGEGSTGEDAARDLANYMTFTYDVGETTREWGMQYQGVYSTNPETGEVRQYVYSLTAGKTEDNKEIPVRLQFKNGDQVMTSDDFDMSAAQVHQTYDMTIYSGELEQGQIKAKLTVGEEGTEQSISCDIKIGSGELTIRSVVDKIDNTNAIAADENAVTDTETATAVPNGDVDYYVNDSKVEVKNEGDRVQLLVDQVSDNTDFNAAMGNDAVAKVNAALEEGNTLSNAAYDLAYMDLVDTQNGNTVVTMGDNQSLFIYWPVPEDAAADSEFHVVHYTGMDRENTVDADELSVQDADVKTGEGIVDKVTIGDGDQEYVKFTTDSFSPFALVYEKAPDPVAKLEVTKTLTKVNGQPYTGGSVSVNDTLTYTITVKNGEVALNNVTITDTFNGKGDLVFNGYTATENPAGTYTINLGNLEANATVTITATYKVLRADASSNLTNTVSVTGTPTDGGEPTTGGDTETTPVNPYHPPIRPPVDPDKPELNTEDHYAYIVGYEDGSVQPEGDITRAEVATIFFRLLTDESRNEYWSQTNPYSDVSADDWFNNAVSTLTNAGVLDGYEDGTFKPNGNITRAEFATITARFFEATYDGENLFPDIEGHWAQDYINEAANAGIVNGYEDGTFRPQQYITRAEAVTMVNRTIERHPDADHLLDDMITWPDNPETAWYYEQIQEATNSHEYTMNTDDEQNPYEIWTELLPNRDWSELEKVWSDANDGAGSGEVV